jgi:hypothetical protein
VCIANAPVGLLHLSNAGCGVYPSQHIPQCSQRQGSRNSLGLGQQIVSVKVLCYACCAVLCMAAACQSR